MLICPATWHECAAPKPLPHRHCEEPEAPLYRHCEKPEAPLYRHCEKPQATKQPRKVSARSSRPPGLLPPAQGRGRNDAGRNCYDRAEIRNVGGSGGLDAKRAEAAPC